MSNLFFFKKDGRCRWMQKEIEYYLPKLLHDAVDIDLIRMIKDLKLINPFNGKKKFYLILDWIIGKNKGANLPWLNELGVNYVKNINELPDNSGIYIAGYDSDINEVNNAINNGVSIIDHACPWVRQLKKQILEQTEQYQAVLLIDKDHMVYNCYKEYFPKDIIIVSIENFEEEITNGYKGKPIFLMSYATFRKKDIKKIADFINKKFYNKDNMLDNYKKTLCCWSNQGLLEEIETEVKNNKIDQIWVICSNTGDRSTRSILNEITESGASFIPIKKSEDIPEKIDPNVNIGILLAPIPVSKKVMEIIDIIKNKIKLKDENI